MRTAALAAAFTFMALAAPVVEAAPPIPADGAAPVKTASGLVYSVLTPGGTGLAPKVGDAVTVHYTGWLTDGTVFDSSHERGTPATFAVGELIPGWNEALTLMTPGARWKLTIPAQLGYGPQGSPPKIPGGATLIFEIELLRLPSFHRGDPSKQITTASGLTYEVLATGTGASAAATDVVELDYALWNTAGKLLDASAKSGNNLKSPLGDLPLAFLKEAVPLLRPGGRLWLKVPPQLAFGAQNQGADLPPGSTTIWEVGLVSLKPPLPCPPFAASAPGAARRLPSGLQIEVLVEGTGRSPKIGEMVTVHYAGWLEDQTLFDSSFARGEPASFQLGRVIQGWNEGLQLMKEGGKARLTIPGPIAYGPGGSPPKIGPNATLIFFVELIKVGP